MIWIVSGFARSGTSMMMLALQAGGMEVYYCREKEEKLKRDYPDRGNSSYLEVREGEQNELWFPLDHQGKLIKLLGPWVNLGNLAVHEYRIVFMVRDPREIAVSLAKLYGGAIPKADHDILFKRYDQCMGKALSLCRNRQDFRSVHLVAYGSVLENPLPIFEGLAANGWPIDAQKAAAAIDPSLRSVRFNGPDDKEPYKELIRNMPPDKRRVTLEELSK